MNAEELKQEAGKCLKDNIRTEKKDGMTFNIVPTPAQIYCAGAEPREKQIAELEQEIKVLAQNLEDTEICENGWKNRVKELEAQIEKMKCCYNCKHSRTEYEHCRTDKSEKWEIKEK